MVFALYVKLFLIIFVFYCLVLTVLVFVVWFFHFLHNFLKMIFLCCWFFHS